MLKVGEARRFVMCIPARLTSPQDAYTNICPTLPYHLPYPTLPKQGIRAQAHRFEDDAGEVLGVELAGLRPAPGRVRVEVLPVDRDLGELVRVGVVEGVGCGRDLWHHLPSRIARQHLVKEGKQPIKSPQVLEENCTGSLYHTKLPLHTGCTYIYTCIHNIYISII